MTEKETQLLDQFAMAALQGELASQHPEWDRTGANYNASDEDAEQLANWTYCMALAMMKARKSARKHINSLGN